MEKSTPCSPRVEKIFKLNIVPTPPKTKEEMKREIDFLMTLPHWQRADHERNPITNMQVEPELKLYAFEYLDQLFKEELKQKLKN